MKAQPSKPASGKPRKQEREKPELAGPGKPRPILPGRWEKNLLCFVVLAVGTIGLYAPDLHLGFFKVDDPDYVVNNPWIKGVTTDHVRHILSSPYFTNYSPLHLLSYMLDNALAGINPVAFHFSSNLWAGVVAGLVFLVALALTGRWLVAFAAGVLFVVYPAHVEAVAWISSRKDLVGAAFALASLLAYLRYRRGGGAAIWWYVATVLLFVCALAGKLSVATFPAVFLALDLFVEKRAPLQSLPDKVPFLLAGGLMALVVAAAQPVTGNRPDAYVLSAALLHNFWLLVGFGPYVIYRVPPNAATSIGIWLAAAVFLLVIFAAPLLLRRRFPLTTVLVYWMLFAFIPSQVLSFTHPVADRYLFFPSVAAVILLAWGVVTTAERLGSRGVYAAVALLLTIALFWAGATLGYLREWRDPRSVWYSASRVSSDPDVFANLGWHYLDTGARFGTTPRKGRLSDEESRRLASLVWANDSRLPALLTEWSAGQRGGPTERLFQEHLWMLAWEALAQTLATKGKRVMPDLYFHRGLILLDRGDKEGAQKEFLAALDEAGRSRFAEGREEIIVNSYNDLGILAWQAGDYQEALRWLRLAEEEQGRFAGNWIPELKSNRERLEAIIASLSRH